MVYFLKSLTGWRHFCTSCIDTHKNEGSLVLEVSLGYAVSGSHQNALPSLCAWVVLCVTPIFYESKDH